MNLKKSAWKSSIWLVVSIIYSSAPLANTLRTIEPNYTLEIHAMRSDRIHSSKPQEEIRLEGVPIGQSQQVVFKVVDQKKTFFEPKDRVEIWQVDRDKKKIHSLGIAQDPEVQKRMTTGEPIPKFLKYTFKESQEVTHYYKAYIYAASGKTYESNTVEFHFYDQAQFDHKIRQGLKRADTLRQKIPQRQLTTSECAKEGGQIEHTGEVSLKEKSSIEPCSAGKPLGYITGVRCMCICCKK